MPGIGRRNFSILRRLSGGAWRILRTCCCTGCAYCSSWVTAGAADVVPDVTTQVVAEFGGGTSFAAGCYRVLYVAGAYRPFDDPDDPVLGGFYPYDAWPFFVVLAGADFAATSDAAYVGYATQAAAEAAHAGESRAFVHAGGTIGVRCDRPFAGRMVSGSPDPTFRLERCDD